MESRPGVGRVAVASRDIPCHQLVVQDNYKTLHKLFVDVVPLPDFENCVEYGDDDKHKSKKML